MRLALLAAIQQSRMRQLVQRDRLYIDRRVRVQDRTRVDFRLGLSGYRGGRGTKEWRKAPAKLASESLGESAEADRRCDDTEYCEEVEGGAQRAHPTG